MNKVTGCPFCYINCDDEVNTIIEETDNFAILPSKGALVEGYLLILPKQHVTSMNELGDGEKEELKNLIDKYRGIFYNKFGKYPIIFEHGTNMQDSGNSASSITHAHYHIVNHKFLNEMKVINLLKFDKVDMGIFFEDKHKSYISYISPDFCFYITYNFEKVSQQMRIFIAEDLGIDSQYNWKKSNFDNNITKTINLFKK